MNLTTALAGALLASPLFAVPAAAGGAPVTTRVPTSLLYGFIDIRGGTTVYGLNDSGQYVGTFGERNWVIFGLQHGFIHGSADPSAASEGSGSLGRSTEGFRLGQIVGDVYPDPEYRYLDLVPAASSDFNAQVTTPTAINDAGVVVGSIGSDYLNAAPDVAFRYDTISHAFTTFSVPGAVSTDATGINAAGEIVGNFVDGSGGLHGFLLDNGSYTTIDMPGEVGGTRLGGISDNGLIVGSSIDAANIDSFVYDNGTFSTFNVDGQYTIATDINDAGQVVGRVGISGYRRGFIYQGGQGTILDYAPGGETYVWAINNRGEIAGSINDVGFTAQPGAVPEPTTWVLLVGGFAAVGTATRRRAAMIG